MPPTLKSDLIARIRELSSPLEPVATSTMPRLEPLAGIRAVLFDIYGTLVISGSGDIGLTRLQDGDAVVEALAQMNLAEASRNGADTHGLKEVVLAMHQRRRGEGVEFPEVDIIEVWRELLARCRSEVDEETLMRLAVEHECRNNPVWPMPDLAATLGRLREHGQILGIVSNAQFYTPIMLEAFLDADLDQVGFDPHIAAWSYRLLEGKPSRRPYAGVLDALANEHGINAASVLYVGNDMRNDIWPAQVVGMRTALFAGDARSLRLRGDDPNVRGVVPDRVVTQLSQLPELLRF